MAFNESCSVVVVVLMVVICSRCSSSSSTNNSCSITCRCKGGIRICRSVEVVGTRLHEGFVVYHKDRSWFSRGHKLIQFVGAPGHDRGR